MWEVLIGGRLITGDMLDRAVAYDSEGNERDDYWSDEVLFYTLELTTGEEIDIYKDDLDGSTEQSILQAIDCM